MTVPSPLCVLGLGLIGGSLVRRAAQDRQVTAWSPTASTRAAAAADGYPTVDSLDAALTAAARDDALIVLAAPLPAFDDLLSAVARFAPRNRVTDVASVKTPVADLVEEILPDGRYVGGHPMAGTQYSGWAAGDAALFEDAVWATTLTDDSDVDTWSAVAELALAAGSRVVPCEPDAHDQAVARISHLAHLLALVLAQVGADGGPLALSLAAGSFADGTRVAATRPELVRAMCEANRSALVGAVDDALGVLGVARGPWPRPGHCKKLTSAGHQGRTAFDDRGQDLGQVTLSGDDLIDQLLAVGASGGAVTGLTRGPAGLSVSATYPADE